tara:strand:+ start:1723 stop:2454 length:732 start_codon:yes stop_codon:yes gene_type:complete
MDFILNLTIILISIVQSIFGVGVLLFGTPLLMVYNYDFTITLLILLPISIAISLLQVFKNIKNIDFIFYKRFLTFSIPFLIGFLAIGIQHSLNFSLIIGLFLIFVSLKNTSEIIKKSLVFLRNYEKVSFITMGIIHGLTNLGGSFLTAMVFNKNQSKNYIRSTIAICYATFAIFQILTLIFIIGAHKVFFFFDIKLFLVGILTFFVADRLIYSRMDMEKYEKSFSIFLFLFGFSLMIKNFYEF